MEFTVLDLEQMLSHFVRMVGAFLLALPIGWERERHAEHKLGFRTVPLVAMTTCAFVLVGRSVLPDPASEARVLQGIITGVGFLGGGAIVKQGLNVYGTATAAGIWATAAIGMATAYGRLEIAIVTAAGTFLVLRGLKPVKDGIDNGNAIDGDDGSDD